MFPRFWLFRAAKTAIVWRNFRVFFNQKPSTFDFESTPGGPSSPPPFFGPLEPFLTSKSKYLFYQGFSDDQTLFLKFFLGALEPFLQNEG